MSARGDLAAVDRLRRWRDGCETANTGNYCAGNEAFAKDVAAALRLLGTTPALLAELRKAADTFAELAQTFRIFGYPTAAQACLVAEQSNRAAIANAERTP